MLSIKPDLPLDPIMVEILRHVEAAAVSAGAPCFIVGAMARDLLLHHVHGIRIARPTRDIDFGIAMRGWEQFLDFKKTLCDTGLFFPVNGMVQRLSYRMAEATRGIPVDLVPFGEIESPSGTVAWPPEQTQTMTVTGFDEANANALTIRISNEAIITRVASIPGLTVLKLFAWFDRGRENPKDAQDLTLLLRHYADAGNTDRLYGNELPLLESVEYEFERAGALLLGKDVAAIAHPATLETLNARLDDSRERDRLLTQIALGVTWTDTDDRLNIAKSLLDALHTGLSQNHVTK